MRPYIYLPVIKWKEQSERGQVSAARQVESCKTLPPPHVFKRQPVARNAKVASPLEVYTATVATMQKYVGLTEEQVNRQTYSLVLEHLERMAKENEELEKVRRKK